MEKNSNFGQIQKVVPTTHIPYKNSDIKRKVWLKGKTKALS